MGSGEDEGFVRGGLRRSFTQPLTEQELRDADEKEVMSGVSIAERFVLPSVVTVRWYNLTVQD